MWNCDLGQIRKTLHCIWLHCNGSGLFRTQRWRLTSPFGWPGIEIFTGQNNFIFLSSRFALFLFYSSKGDTRLPQYHNVWHLPDHSNTIYLIRYIYLWLCETVVVLVRNDRQARQQRGTMEKLIEAESAAPYLYHTDDVIRETHWHLSTPALLVLQSGEQLDESHSLGLKSGYPLSVKTMFSTSHLKLGFSSFFKVAPLLFMIILMEKLLQYNLYRFYKE